MYYANKAAKDAKDANCEHLADTLEHAGKRVRESFKNASQTVCDAAGSAKDQVRDHPVRSTLIAVGIGYVLSKLLDR